MAYGVTGIFTYSNATQFDPSSSEFDNLDRLGSCSRDTQPFTMTWGAATLLYKGLTDAAALLLGRQVRQVMKQGTGRLKGQRVVNATLANALLSVTAALLSAGPEVCSKMAGRFAITSCVDLSADFSSDEDKVRTLVELVVERLDTAGVKKVTGADVLKLRADADERVEQKRSAMQQRRQRWDAMINNPEFAPILSWAEVLRLPGLADHLRAFTLPDGRSWPTVDCFAAPPPPSRPPQPPRTGTARPAIVAAAPDAEAEVVDAVVVDVEEPPADAGSASPSRVDDAAPSSASSSPAQSADRETVVQQIVKQVAKQVLEAEEKSIAGFSDAFYCKGFVPEAELKQVIACLEKTNAWEAFDEGDRVKQMLWHVPPNGSVGLLPYVDGNPRRSFQPMPEPLWELAQRYATFHPEMRGDVAMACRVNKGSDSIERWVDDETTVITFAGMTVDLTFHGKKLTPLYLPPGSVYYLPGNCARRVQFTKWPAYWIELRNHPATQYWKVHDVFISFNDRSKQFDITRRDKNGAKRGRVTAYKRDAGVTHDSEFLVDAVDL